LENQVLFLILYLIQEQKYAISFYGGGGERVVAAIWGSRLPIKT
jgi:hypothetical protein